MIQGILKKVFKAREKLGSNRDDDNPEAEKPFLEHLDDLRVMIIRVVTTLIVSLIICFAFNSVLINIIEAPLGFIDVPVEVETTDDQGEKITEIVQKPLNTVMRPISIDPVGVFMLAIKVSFLAALTISFPFLIYFLLQFILPGLKENEKKILWPAMAIGFGLFIMGVLFAYFVVVPRAMQFFYMFGVERGIDVQWTVELYTKFAIRFILIFGICFELPVLVMALVKLDILNYTFMAKRRGAAIVILFFVAAVITPTHDALTLALLGAPMYILYEICIWLSYFMEKRDRKLNPELYEAKERIEAELAAEADKPMQWGGFGGGDDDEDHQHDDDFHHDDYHHDDDWHDPHSDDPHHDEHGHDDYDEHLHNPDHETVDDADHGGGTRLDAGSHEDTVEKDHAADHDDPHHEDPYHDEFEHGHGDDQDEIDEYHRHLAEFEAEEAKREAEEKAEEAKLQAESDREHSEAKDDTDTLDDADDHEATLEEFSARDESADESAGPKATGLPTGAALGDTTGLGDQPAKSVPNLEARIRDLEDLVNRMADRIDALETRSDDS